ncbi:MAG: hypothetical protein JWM47_4555 [Acidimicrobiales bacterium]|nr:hypothetical protein [Acidimicrobiales bacterium]
MLPRLFSHGWRCVPAGDGQDSPRALSFRFEGSWQGVQIIGTAIARNDQIELYPLPGVCLEIPLAGFEDLTPKLIVAAHTRQP